MSKKRDIIINPKFLPGKEYRKCPDDSRLLVGEPDPYDILTYRQSMRLWYRNWIGVWRTYDYFSRHFLIGGLVAGLLTGSWLVTGAAIIAWILFRMFVRSRLRFFMGISLLVPALFDARLTEQFGPLFPFEDECE